MVMVIQDQGVDGDVTYKFLVRGVQGWDVTHKFLVRIVRGVRGWKTWWRKYRKRDGPTCLVRASGTISLVP